MYLNQNDKAPNAGYLLPESEVIQLRNNTLDMNLYKSENTLKDTQIKLLTDQNINLSNTLQSTSSLSTWEKVGYFAAGVVITGLAISAAHEIYH